MRFALSEEHRDLAAAVREFLDKQCTADDVRRAWADGISRDRWRALAQMGVLDVATSFDLVAAVAVLRECGYAGVPEPVVEATVATWCGVQFTEQVVTAGFDSYVAHADAADLLVLRHRDALHVVPRAAVHVSAQRSLDGARPLYTIEWSPSDTTRVDADVSAASDVGALGTAAFLVGVANRMLDLAVEHAKVRHQFGRPIGSFQAVKHALADVVVDLEFAWPLVLRAAAAPASLHASAAKAKASEAAVHAARTALQVHGAIGYTFEHDLHLWLKRAHVLSAAWGDAAHHYERVSRAVVEVPRDAFPSYAQRAPTV